MVRDPATGKQFVMKLGNSAAHLEEEMAADAAYRALGVPVPNYKRYVGKDGKPVKLAAVPGKDAFRGPMPPAGA